MIIHTVKKDETVFSIARKYGVSPVKIIENNLLPYPDRLIVGQMLLILTPTRTHIVRGGDTLLKLCRRFNVKKKELLANNPSLHGRQTLHAGTELVIRYDTPTNGSAAINGYVYENTPPDRFWTMLPYLTYVTFCAPDEQSEIWALEVLKEKKIPLLRVVWQQLYEKYQHEKNTFIDMAKDAKKKGFGGITLTPIPRDIESEKAANFLFEIKKQLLGLDMLLFQECDAEKCEPCIDVADGMIAMYEKCHQKDIPSFSDGEHAVLQCFGDCMEVGKTFIELSSFGYDEEKFYTLDQILKIALKYGAEIENDEEKMISTIKYALYKGGEKKPLCINFESLKNIKAKLELMHEFGFMGVAVDVGRVPISYIMMVYNLFASVEQPYMGILGG